MRPLVFVHGFMGGGEQWEDQAPLAAVRPLVRLDLPGFGRNAALPAIGSIGGFAEWVLEELSRKGIDDFDLLGHSMGGMIVQEIVARAPARVARLIFYGTGPIGVLPGRFESIETSMARAQVDGPRKTARRIAATWFRAREAAPGFEACARIAEASSLTAILAGLAAMRDWSGEAGLPRISCPTLVIWGDGDRTYAWSQIERLWLTVPGAQLAVVPGCAHAVHMERPEIFNLLVDGFLGRAPDGAGGRAAFTVPAG